MHAAPEWPMLTTCGLWLPPMTVRLAVWKSGESWLVAMSLFSGLTLFGSEGWPDINASAGALGTTKSLVWVQLP